MARGGKREGAGRKPGLIAPAKQELVTAAKDMALDMLEVLKGIANDVQAPTAARVSAATAIIDRGYGKAPQALDLSSSDGSMSPRPNVMSLSPRMSLMKARIEELPKLTANFARPARTRVFKGGRGSGKTRGLALRSALRVYQLAEIGVEGVFLASREHLNSLDESSMEEIKTAIRSVDWLHAYFDIGEKYIRTRNRRIGYAFAGLRHNLDSIKSKARIIGNWTDEGENVSEVAYRKLIPTIREEGVGWQAENWISYNPESPESATHKRFVANKPDDCIVTTVNWSDNPWFPKILEAQRLEDQRLRPDTYDHVWEGEFLTLTEAQVFSGRFSVQEFEPGANWDGPYNGLDFGFAQDPTAAVQVWIYDGRVYIRREAGKAKLELDETAQYINERIPGFNGAVIRADSARPESISYLRRHGFSQIEACEKWKGSVEDGIAFLKSFVEIVIHPDCPQTAREFRLYSHKVDRLSGEIRTDIVDEHNHFIDAIRYAVGPMIKAGNSAIMFLSKRHR